MRKKRGLSDAVAAALIAAATTSPITAYVAYTHHVEEMARISGEGEKRRGDVIAADRTTVSEALDARCSAALRFLGDENINPALKAAETQVLLTDMRQVAKESCSYGLPDDLGGEHAQSLGTKEARR